MRIKALPQLVLRIVCVPACLALTACKTPSKASASRSQGMIDPTRVETRDDITAVYQFYTVPWLRNADGQIVGFKSAVYFHSAKTERGAFVPGSVLVWLYEVAREPDGSRTRKFLHNWELDEREAMNYRIRKRSNMGYFYGLFFTWPPELNLSGKQVEIVFGYERGDGKVITGAPRRFRVPLSAEDSRRSNQPRRRPAELKPQRSQAAPARSDSASEREPNR